MIAKPSDTPRTDDVRRELAALPKFGQYEFNADAQIMLVLQRYSELERELAAANEKEKHTKAVLKTMERDLREQLAAANDQVEALRKDLSVTTRQRDETYAELERVRDRLQRITFGERHEPY